MWIGILLGFSLFGSSATTYAQEGLFDRSVVESLAGRSQKLAIKSRAQYEALLGPKGNPSAQAELHSMRRQLAEFLNSTPITPSPVPWERQPFEDWRRMRQSLAAAPQDALLEQMTLEFMASRLRNPPDSELCRQVKQGYLLLSYLVAPGKTQIGLEFPDSKLFLFAIFYASSVAAEKFPCRELTNFLTHRELAGHPEYPGTQMDDGRVQFVFEGKYRVVADPKPDAKKDCSLGWDYSWQGAQYPMTEMSDGKLVESPVTSFCETVKRWQARVPLPVRSN